MVQYLFTCYCSEKDGNIKPGAWFTLMNVVNKFKPSRWLIDNMVYHSLNRHKMHNLTEIDDLNRAYLLATRGASKLYIEDVLGFCIKAGWFTNAELLAKIMGRNFEIGDIMQIINFYLQRNSKISKEERDQLIAFSQKYLIAKDLEFALARIKKIV